MSTDKRVDRLNELLTDQPQNPLRPHQVDQYQRELRRLGHQAEAKDLDGVPRHWVPADRADAVSQARRIKRTLQDQAPKHITEPMRRDEVAKLTKEVIDETIRPSMLPQEVMRRNPPGAVDEFMRRENSPFIKRAVLTVKRALFGLEPDSQGTDLANLEKYRPSVGSQGGVSTFMADAQIPGVFAQSPAAKAQWPLGEPTAETALKQTLKRENRAKAQREREMGPDADKRKAWGQKMAEIRKAKKQQRDAGVIEAPES